ncbi:hypothetical protein OCU04_003015 [Sclerotinia nivalis]|uniref:Uncharacterized protein n=1 Tax=Sclerotinia nivalis TaxID=352851 RepID=A0A9X0DMS0_9HELO|nr:hypothetical protein OCU04_003015 [Sclerotinia nivalis]
MAILDPGLSKKYFSIDQAPLPGRRRVRQLDADPTVWLPGQNTYRAMGSRSLPKSLEFESGGTNSD